MPFKKTTEVIDTRYAPPAIQRATWTPSPQQSAIWQYLLSATGHLVIKAGAGCGKTTTSVEALFQVPAEWSVAFMAFGKAIANELRSRVPSGVVASTLNSFGGGVIYRHFGKVSLDEYNVSKVAERLHGKRINFGDSVAISKLVSLCKSNLLEGTYEDCQTLNGHFDLEIQNKSFVFDMVQDVLMTQLEEAQQDLVAIDFDDQLWLPVALNLEIKPFDLLIVDESQDLNPVQQELVMRAGKRIVLVGDENQSIYGFRGADSESMATMTSRLTETSIGSTTLPLNYTRRCPRSHVRLANALVKEFYATDDAPEGSISTISPTKALAAFKPGDLVLCRVNAPLISTAFSLLQRGTRVRIQGRDLGKSLLSLVKRFKPESIDMLLDRLRVYQQREEDRIRKDFKFPEGKLGALQDKCDCLRYICSGVQDNFDCLSVDDQNTYNEVEEVKSQITTLFTEVEGEDSSFVLLSSVHRGKGLEAKRVYILEPKILIHPMARKDAARKQERNLAYVAVTRSKDELIFVGDIPSYFRGYYAEK